MKSSIAGIFCLLLLASCSKKSDAELYREGLAAESQKNFTLAVERYNAVVERNTNQAYAESSQYNIAMLYTNNDSDKQKAAEAHRRFCQLFPSSKQTPTLLFLLGFIYNNDLHNMDSARSVYQRFLRSYPDHELAKSARFELDNLGRNPEDYLRLQLADGAQKPDDNTSKPASGKSKPAHK